MFDVDVDSVNYKLCMRPFHRILESKLELGLPCTAAGLDSLFEGTSALTAVVTRGTSVAVALLVLKFVTVFKPVVVDTVVGPSWGVWG